MELLQLREKEIFETLKKIKKFKFVVIGGYAANAYTLPRFSVDCDIVTNNEIEAKKIGKELEDINYTKKEAKNLLYKGQFLRYEKELDNNFKVNIDILIEHIFDRQTGTIFNAKWIFKNSDLRFLKGKTISEKLKLRIINQNALIVMKFISCRATDIRDVFMLILHVKDTKWVKEEINKRYDFKNRFTKIKEKIISPKFKDNLQGVYGYIDNKIFEKHKKALLDLE